MAFGYFELVSGILAGMLITFIIGETAPIIGVVAGESMHPTIQRGTSIYACEEINGDDIETGDIVMWYRNGTGPSVMHRVVEVREETIVTQGDNTDTSDPPVEKHHVMCRYLWHVHLTNKELL